MVSGAGRNVSAAMRASGDLHPVRTVHANYFHLLQKCLCPRSSRMEIWGTPLDKYLDPLRCLLKAKGIQNGQWKQYTPATASEQA